MGEKRHETPVPRGTDTSVLGWLTSVGTPETGYEPPPTVERLFMRLRIFWFFLMAIPILVGAALSASLLAMAARLLFGPGSEQAETITSAAGVVGFLVGLALFVRLFALWFNRLTRRYRARLEARASAESAIAERPSIAGQGRVLDHVSLAELDARLASREPTETEGR